jgi:hypothetical protein
VLLVPAAVAGAGGGGGRATTLGAESRISGPAATAWEQRADVAWNSSTGQYLVVWSDGRADDARGEDIYARLVGADGKPIGGEKVISGDDANGDDQAPAIAWGATTSQYLVVWQDGRGPSRDIYGRLVGADGKPIGKDFRVGNSVYDELNPDVAWSSSANTFLVVWEDYRDTGSKGAEIYGRRVGANGAPLGTEDFLISGPGATADDVTPAVAWGATTKQYLVVWSDYRNYGATGSDVYGHRVTAAGAPTGADIRISGAGAIKNEYVPAVAWGATLNQFLVVWEDWRRPPDRGLEIYGQRVKVNGALAGGEKLISGTKATADETAPAVAWSATSHQFLVVWQDWRNYWVPPAPVLRYADIFGRKVAEGGGLLGSDFRICGPKALLNDYDPAAAWNGVLNQYLVVWTDARSYFDGRSFDIYSRLVGG